MTDVDTQAATWLDGLGEAVLVVEAGRITAANAGAARLLDAPVESLPGRPLKAVVCAEEVERLSRILERVLAREAQPRPLRLRLSRLSDHREVPVDLRLAASGRQVVLCARDATATARAEDLIGYLAQLTGTAETFADVDALLETSEPIFQALGWYLVFLDVDGETVTVRRFIRPARGNLEVPPLMPHPGERIPTEHTVGVYRALATGRGVRVDDLPGGLVAARPGTAALAEALTRHGILRAAYCPVHTGERIAHVVAVAGADLSDWDFVAIELFAAQLGSTLRLAGLQAELVARERLAGLGDLNTEFARRLSRSAAIIDDAAVRLEGTLPEAGAGSQLLGMLREEVARLGRLALDLVAFARPVTTQVVAMDLGAVVRTALAAARAAAGPGAAAAEASVDVPETLPRVAGDAQLLPEAVGAMLLNAFQHLPPGGRVKVRASQADGQVALTLENDGPPIPAEVAPRVFEPFFTTKATGTGLGLAMVRRTVEELGGTVTLEPSDDGVRFRVVLRVAR